MYYDKIFIADVMKGLNCGDVNNGEDRCNACISIRCRNTCFHEFRIQIFLKSFPIKKTKLRNKISPEILNKIRIIKQMRKKL